MVFKNELYPIHFYGRVRGKCDGRLQNWPGIANERPKFLAMGSWRPAGREYCDPHADQNPIGLEGGKSKQSCA